MVESKCAATTLTLIQTITCSQLRDPFSQRSPSASTNYPGGGIPPVLSSCTRHCVRLQASHRHRLAPSWFRIANVHANNADASYSFFFVPAARAPKCANSHSVASIQAVLEVVGGGEVSLLPRTPRDLPASHQAELPLVDRAFR